MNKSPRYESPLGARYASPAMQQLWSGEHRARLWRELWLALAEEQQRLGLDIPDGAIEEMRAHLADVDLESVRRYEERCRHDVMAHVYAFGDQAPAARATLHLGATSAYVTDNADLIIMRDALKLVLGRLAAVVEALVSFAMEYREMPTVGYTHFQPAQLTTVGKRASLWLQDFCLDSQDILSLVAGLPFRGCKGTTGTQASYLELFHGDHAKVRELDRAIAKRFGFEQSIPVSGQTYTRKIDSSVLARLSAVGQSAAKYATDLRLLQHEGEVLEPRETDQIGSSAMAYKRNPMRAERICALARHVITLSANAANTAATQWLERTLDDSANRRLTIPEAFLAVDAILVLCSNVASGLEVNGAVVANNVMRVMPFMATERWLMLAVEAGGDRQELHEVIQRHSRAVQDSVRVCSSDNDLLDRLSNEPAFSRVDTAALRAQLDPTLYVGRAPEQVLEFVRGPVAEILESLAAHKTPDSAAVKL